MTGNINRAVSLTSYLITLPSAAYLIFAMLLFGTILGMLIDYGRYPMAELPARGFTDGFMLLTAPALISSVLIQLMVRKMPFRRIAATALAGQVLYGLAYLASLMLAGVNPILAQLALLVGSALVFVLWYVIARFVFILKYRSVLFAVLQLLLYLLFLVSNQALTAEPFLPLAAKFLLSACVLMLALLIFFIIINAPMKKNLGVSSTDAVSYLFSQWLYHNRDMEKAFERVGEHAKTMLCVFGFRRRSDTVFFLTPYVHFGPFGNLGGSEFSYLLAKEMDRKHGSRTFVFHGTVTHDLNPVSASEMAKILAAADSAVKEASYSDAKVSLSVGRMEECRAESLRINDSAMIGLTRSPQLTEDINLGLGMAIMSEAEKRAKSVMLVDQHNAETGEITSFEPGSRIGFNYLAAVADSFSKPGKGNPLRLGVSSRPAGSAVVGQAGIKVAVFSSSPEYAIILIDSNGVTPEFRDRIEAEVKKTAKALGKNVTVGVFTTDTHQTNMVRGVLNPLRDEENLLAAVKDAFADAVADMQPAQFFADKRWFDINVIGAKQSIELISTVNSIVAVAKFILPMILILALLLLFAVLSVV